MDVSLGVLVTGLLVFFVDGGCARLNDEDMKFNNAELTMKDAVEFCKKHGVQLPVDFNVLDVQKVREKITGPVGCKTLSVWTGLKRREFPKYIAHDGQSIVLNLNYGDGGCLAHENGKIKRVKCLEKLNGVICQIPGCTRCYKETCRYNKQLNICYRLKRGELNWYQAKEECTLLNGRLLHPNHTALLSAHIPKGISFWVDGTNEKWEYYDGDQDISSETDFDIDSDSQGDCLIFSLKDNLKRSYCSNSHATLCIRRTVNHDEVFSSVGATNEQTVTEIQQKETNSSDHPFLGCDYSIKTLLPFVYYGIAALATGNLFVCCVCLWCQVRRANEKRKRKSRAKLPSVKELTSRRNRKSNSHKLDDTSEQQDLATINMPRYFKNVSADFRKLSTEHKTFNGEKRSSKLIAQGYRNSKSLTILSSESNEFYEVPVDHRTFPLHMSRVGKKTSDDPQADGAMAKKLSAFFEGSMLGGAVSLPQMSVIFSDDYNEPLDTLMPPPPLSLYVSEDEEVNKKNSVCKPNDPFGTSL